MIPLHFPVSNADFLFFVGLVQLFVVVTIATYCYRAFSRMRYAVLLFPLLYFGVEIVNQIGVILLAHHSVAIGQKIPLNPLIYFALPSRAVVCILAVLYFRKYGLAAKVGGDAGKPAANEGKTPGQTE